MMKELIEIQSKLKAPKGQYNTFGKYKYRSAEDILEAVKPLLAEQKCTLVLSDDVIAIGNRIYIKTTATISNTDGAEVVNTAYAREDETKKGMDVSQITGTASSYARKYALNGLFLIDDTKDADTDGYHKQNTTAQEQINASQEVLKQATTAVNAVKDRSQLQQVWEQWTGKYQHLKDPNGVFFATVQAKSLTLK